MEEKDIPPCMIYIDKEGSWFHKGAEMIHREIIRHLYQYMEFDPQGRYIVNWMGDRCYVEVEDTPFVVKRAVFEKAYQSVGSRVILYLCDETKEVLDPDTLFVGNYNVLYCRVRDGRFPSRFSRAAYYQLGKYIEEDNGRYYLPLDGKKYDIKKRSATGPAS